MFSYEEVQRTKYNLILFTIVLVVSNIFANRFSGAKLFDETWSNFAFATLIGFTINGLGTNKLYNMIVPSLDKNNIGLLTSFQDIITWSTVFLSQKLIVSYLENKPVIFDNLWLMSSGLTITGYCLYNLFINNMMPNVGTFYQSAANDIIKVSMGALLTNYIVDGTITNIHLISLSGILTGFTIFHLGVKNFIETKSVSDKINN